MVVTVDSGTEEVPPTTTSFGAVSPWISARLMSSQSRTADGMVPFDGTRRMGASLSLASGAAARASGKLSPEATTMLPFHTALVRAATNLVASAAAVE